MRADNGDTKFFTLDKGDDSPQRGFMIRSGDFNFVDLPYKWDDEFALWLNNGAPTDPASPEFDRWAALMDAP